MTMQKRSERLVTIKPEDHPFIQHDSIVAYGFSKIRMVDDIEAAFRDGLAKPKQPIDAKLLARVQAGLRDSDFTPNGVRHYYKAVSPETL
jgi:hypothetical protein